MCLLCTVSASGCVCTLHACYHTVDILTSSRQKKKAVAKAWPCAPPRRCDKCARTRYPQHGVPCSGLGPGHPTWAVMRGGTVASQLLSENASASSWKSPALYLRTPAAAIRNGDPSLATSGMQGTCDCLPCLQAEQQGDTGLLHSHMKIREPMLGQTALWRRQHHHASNAVAHHYGSNSHFHGIPGDVLAAALQADHRVSLPQKLY
jgi:hypothetical protein